MLRDLVYAMCVICIFFISGCKISGTVYDKGSPVQDAIVYLDGKIHLTTRTDSSGNYVFEDVKITSGTFTITAEWAGTTLYPSEKKLDISYYDVPSVDFFTEPTWEGSYDTLAHRGRLDDLEGYSCITRNLIIRNTNLENLKGLESLTYIDGDLRISFNGRLTSLEGIENVNTIDEDIIFLNNNALINLVGLENVTSGVDNLRIVGNESLTSLKGLENITSTGQELEIRDNDALTSLGLDSIYSVGTDFTIVDNDELCSYHAEDLRDEIVARSGAFAIGWDVIILGNKICPAP